MRPTSSWLTLSSYVDVVFCLLGWVFVCLLVLRKDELFSSGKPELVPVSILLSESLLLLCRFYWLHRGTYLHCAHGYDREDCESLNWRKLPDWWDRPEAIKVSGESLKLGGDGNVLLGVCAVSQWDLPPLLLTGDMSTSFSSRGFGMIVSMFSRLACNRWSKVRAECPHALKPLIPAALTIVLLLLCGISPCSSFSR